MRSNFLIVVLSLTMFTAAACKKDAHHDHGEAHAAVCSHSLTAAEYGGAEIVSQPGAKIGQLTRCPISGSVFKVTETTPSTEQKGEPYYVCCGGCVEQLEKSFARRR